MLLLKVVEAMNLHYLLVLGQRLHNGTLQLTSLVLTRGYGIDSDGHNDAVPLKHLLRDTSRQTMYLVGIHRIIDVDMERADKDVWAVVVQNDIEHTMNTIKRDKSAW